MSCSHDLHLFVGNKTKGRISNRVFQEHKASQIFRKTNILNPVIRTRTCAYQGFRNVRFSENLACFMFLKHPFWDSPFPLLPTYFTFHSDVFYVSFGRTLRFIRTFQRKSSFAFSFTKRENFLEKCFENSLLKKIKVRTNFKMKKQVFLTFLCIAGSFQEILCSF